MKLLIFIIICLIAFILLHHTTKYKHDLQILQTNIETLTTDTFLERYPIVISEAIVDPMQIVNITMKYLYLWCNQYDYNNNNIPHFNELLKIRCNLSKYLIIHNNTSHSNNVAVIQPTFKHLLQTTKSTNNYYSVSPFSTNDKNDNLNIQFIDIILHPNQVLILPSNWCFETYTPLKEIATYDISHWITNSYRM